MWWGKWVNVKSCPNGKSQFNLKEVHWTVFNLDMWKSTHFVSTGEYFVLWYFTSSFFWASLAALYATAAQWLHWIKPTMALLGEGCNFLVMCVLCWCAGYEGTHRDSISLCVMQSLLRKVEIASRFSIIKVVHESLRIDSNFHGVAENKRMFAVMVNLQTGEGKLMEWGVKLNPFGLLTSQRRFSSAS